MTWWIGVTRWSICFLYVNSAEIWRLTWQNLYHSAWLRVNQCVGKQISKWSERDLEVINRILSFRPCWKFSTMKTIHLRERKASKEFAPVLQTEPRIMSLWCQTHVIHYFSLHKENLVYDVASDIRRVSPDWRQVFLASAVPAELYARRMRRFCSATVSTYQIYIFFTIGSGCNAWMQKTQTTRWLIFGLLWLQFLSFYQPDCRLER